MGKKVALVLVIMALLLVEGDCSIGRQDIRGQESPHGLRIR